MVIVTVIYLILASLPCTLTDTFDGSKRNLLCTVFVDFSAIKVVENLVSNIRYARNHCDWALVSYVRVKPDPLLCDQLIATAQSVASTIRFLLPQIRPQDETPERLPKPVLFHLLLPYLSKYKRIWLLDEDLSIQYFNFDEYFDAWDCYHSPLSKTLITQPLIDGRTTFSYFNTNAWAVIKDIIAAIPTDFVEQQAPILDASFFSWFIIDVMKPALKAMKKTETDLGHDETWCGAARHYATRTDPLSRKEAICYIISAHSVVVHQDFQTIKSRNENQTDYWYKGNFARQLYAAKYPHYFISTGDNNIWKDKSLWVSYENFKRQCNKTSLKYLTSTVAEQSRRIKSNLGNQKRLLCAVFVDFSNPMVVDGIETNIKYAKENCEWILISYVAGDTQKKFLYDSSPISISDKLMEVASKCGSEVRFILPELKINPTNTSYIQKPYLFELLLSYLPKYRRVWLLDEDLVITSFNFEEYFAIWDCPNSPLKHTLITQPLTKGKSSFSYLSINAWSVIKDVIAAIMTDFIEHNTPILDSHFFSWFISEVIVPTLETTPDLETDIGYDETWCGAARHYSTSNSIGHLSQSGSVCAIISAHSMIIIPNSQNVKTLRKEKSTYQERGSIARQVYSDRYPFFFKVASANVLWKDKSLWIPYSKFDHQCLVNNTK